MKHCQACGAPFEGVNSKYCSIECARPASKNRRHGYSFTPVHNAWCDMRKRCTDAGHHAYARYGGRGIKVCERWDVFENFLADMGDKPSKEYSIERMDNDKDYEPGNCKWATRKEQSVNRACVWTAEQVAILKYGIERSVSDETIAAFLQKTPGAIDNRARRIGLRGKKNAGVTNVSFELLHEDGRRETQGR